MKAMIYKKYGTTDVLELMEIEKPVPDDNEVLIKIHATTVTPIDWKFRSGKLVLGRLLSGITKPKNPILGAELAGEVEAVGSKVKLYKEKDKIYASVQGGAYAEYVCIDEQKIVKMPSIMSFEEAASVPFGGVTAYHFLVKVGKMVKG